MLDNWNCIESDFQREYNINLSQSIQTMSFRRFTALLKGLSINSNWYIINNSKDNVIKDPVIAEREVNRIWT